MTNFSPSSSSHLLVILNEFLQLKRDSSCCPAGCMMFISSLSLTSSSAKHPSSEHFFMLFVGLSTVLPFSFPIRFTFSPFHLRLRSPRIVFIFLAIFCAWILSSSATLTHTHPSTVSLTLACTIRKLQHKQFWRGAWEGVVALAERMCCCCWGFGAGLRRRWYL